MKWLKPKDVQDLYGFPVATLARWRGEGTGPVYHKPAGRVLYDSADVDAFVRGARHEPSVRANVNEDRHVNY